MLLGGCAFSKGHGQTFLALSLPKVEDEKDEGAILDAEVYAHFKGGRN